MSSNKVLVDSAEYHRKRHIAFLCRNVHDCGCIDLIEHLRTVRNFELHSESFRVLCSSLSNFPSSLGNFVNLAILLTICPVRAKTIMAE